MHATCAAAAVQCSGMRGAIHGPIPHRQTGGYPPVIVTGSRHIGAQSELQVIRDGFLKAFRAVAEICVMHGSGTLWLGFICLNGVVNGVFGITKESISASLMVKSAE